MSSGPSSFLFCWLRLFPLFGFRHVAFNIEAGHLDGSVAADGDGLLEVAGELALAIVSHLDLALLAGLYGSLGVLGNGASARGDGLVDYQGLLADVGIYKRAGDNGVLLGEGTEVVDGLFKLNLGRLLGHSEGYGTHCHQRHEYHSFHHSRLFVCM